MKANTFVERFSQAECSTKTRDTAQLAVSMLNVLEDTSPCLEVDRETFAEICSVTGITPTKGMVFEFIRIYNEEEDSVDIQTRRSVLDTVGENVFGRQ